uniref:DUF1570 domain-containing protein n=1 Tax=Parerythrobacter lutipelagi TaxID=1964208 RepID=UPI00137611B1|nr:DUF1570 domain-containing protein [Parerythrobacter lutipelagi]
MKTGVAARLLGAFLLWFGWATSASADWHVAESDNFVVYADDREKDIRRFAEYLERYHSALEYVLSRDVPKPSPSNRLTIFVVGGQKDIRELTGSSSIAGFYIPRASGSMAFVQDITFKSDYPSFTTIILLHEYAHHFLISSSRMSMPRWLSEGSAEFFSSASFNKDGSVKIGRDARYRAYELAGSNSVSVEELLDPELYEENRGDRRDDFYGRSWLLYHFLQFSDDRQGQLSEYAQLMAQGMSSLEAGQTAFGDLKSLERDLVLYQMERRRAYLELPAEILTQTKVTLRKLPEGEAEMMPIRIRSQHGVNEEKAQEIVLDAREVAADYPSDAGVLTALAEAEYDAGNDDAAIAAADKAIALDPSRTNAYVQKGYAMFRKAETADDRDAAYTKAMKPLGALNRLENDHPVPLMYYYRSFAERGMEPPEDARHALERAAQLAPFDKGLWFQVAMMQAQEGKIELAGLSLAPLANDPHGGALASRAATIRKLLDDAPEGEAFLPPVIIDMPDVVGADGNDNDDREDDD